jgi:hypothetical protein
VVLMDAPIFVLGAMSIGGADRPDRGWRDLRWYYDCRLPKEVRTWLSVAQIAHSVGWDRLPTTDDQYPNTVAAFITLYDSNAAVELRMRWNAKPTTMSKLHSDWEESRHITLAFGKGERR